ncbi:MAG: peptidylprolyl isomerase [Ignavibacteriales bacterium]|nr:peptidylprolyl isomerase [Ignavibacteriales bacterium]
MKTLFIIISAVLLSISFLFSQSDSAETAKVQREKIDLILQMQDKRTIFDGKLISFISDQDPLIREKAILAFGSIQDTNVIPLLLDRISNDNNSKVVYAAVFAIGQTAGLMSKGKREELDHDLVWARMDQTRGIAKDRLIEEIGKFGSEQALNDLILRFGNDQIAVKPSVLAMSIARFAIRNVVSRDAVLYLLQFIRTDDSTPWQVMYALQRIGKHVEIKNNLEQIAQLWKHRDPLVRMQLAALLGKTRDSLICLEPLRKLFDTDPDWRVRVNAVRALCNFDLKSQNEIVRRIESAFFAGNTNLATAAISSFGNSGIKFDNSNSEIKSAFNSLEKITRNKGNTFLWQLQAEAALALAKLSKGDALKSIYIDNDAGIPLQAQLLSACGATGSLEAAPILQKYIGNENYILYRSAIDGLRELCQRNPDNTNLISKTYQDAIEALKSEDVTVLTTSASLLGDSIFQNKESVPALIDALDRSNIPDDVEAMQEIISTLGKLNDTRSVKILQQQLEQRDNTIVRAALSALRSITGSDYSSQIPAYFEPIYIDFDMDYLHALPETISVTMETLRGDVQMMLFKNAAPFTVMSFLKLATQRGFYRGLSFHRIVPNFVVQGGDPRGDGWGGPGYAIRSEFSPLSYETGTVGMASSGKDTEGSQFFITQSPQPHLDGRYTIFGKVTKGMDVVNRLELDDHILDIRINR